MPLLQVYLTAKKFRTVRKVKTPTIDGLISRTFLEAVKSKIELSLRRHIRSFAGPGKRQRYLLSSFDRTLARFAYLH